ncbi:hypothetical protein CRUP_004382 [Coryphaenoides rupestris]|nr:hypothetical protein CRUP_004382 [Coryphaenoides rupestris]
MSDSPFPSSSSSTTLAPGSRAGGAAGGGVNKPKKDPLEPVKPVSAYALFFRDTQAAIKGQNPSASFSEVSKIVASMWDTLGEEQKQAPIEVLDDPKPSPPSPPPPPPPITPSSSRPSRVQHYNPEENTITNICTSNIILPDIPQMSTRSYTSGSKPPGPAPCPAPNPPLTVTKIIIRQTPSPFGGVTVTATAAPPARQPPPLQPMYAVAPPPPRLQQMVHSQAPPPLQAKPQATPPTGGGSMAPPPPLQIKIVPAILQAASQMEQSAAVVVGGAEVEGEMEVKVSVTPGSGVAPPVGASVDVFMAWCAIRGQNSTTVT